MIRSLAPVVLLLGGCTMNHDELRARLRDAERQLAAQQAAAQRLVAERPTFAQEEEELMRALASDPGAQAVLDNTPLAPTAIPTFPPLPPASALEGSEGAELRELIHVTEKKVVELATMTGTVESRAAQRRQALALIREQRAPPAR